MYLFHNEARKVDERYGTHKRTFEFIISELHFWFENEVFR